MLRPLLAMCSLIVASAATVSTAAELQHDGWIDFNKNGRRDVYEDPSAPLDARIDDLLAQMTLEEKCGQLAQLSGGWMNNGPAVPEGSERDIRAGQVGSFLNLHGAEATRNAQLVAVGGSRLGIPLLFAFDVIHGFRTTFPVPLAEAASWNLGAMEESARIAADEATAHGLHWTFAPMVDVARDPRWGRIVEGAGEDAWLGAKIAAARVRGFQGTDLQAKDTLLACAKHYAAYGGAEGGRDYNAVDVSDRTLRETYLPPFHAAIAAGVATLMPSFNEIAGVPSHANAFLLRDVLRGEWNFDGVVVSDWAAIKQLIPHGIAANPTDAGIAALEAGVDIDMVSDIFAKDLPAAVRVGRLPEAEVDRAVRHVLRAKFRVGLFDDPYRYCDPNREQTRTLTDENRAAAGEIARESIVLLKNDRQTLPLSKTLRSLAVIGALADDAASALGPWAALGRPEEAVSVLAGLRRAVATGTEVRFVRGVAVEGSDTSGIPEAVAAARDAEAVVLVLGETAAMSGEARNRTSLDLPGAQNELAEAVLAAAGDKPVVVVLMNGRPLSIGWLDEHAPAIIEAWFLGVEMGPAVADVLFGDFNPVGKLPVTFPRNVGQVPLYYNHKNTGRPPTADDPFTSKYVDAPWTPLYPFGHGLSYTTFAYRDLKLGASRIGVGDNLDLQVTVANTGERAGTDVVQLYLRDEVGSTTRPVRELRGFERIALAPGESKAVRFTLSPDDLACYDREMQRRVEPGFFTVYVGTDSTATLAQRFEVVARPTP